MKKQFYLAVVLVVGFLSTEAKAQVPVTDAASLTEQVREGVRTAIRWLQEYEQLKMQVDMLRRSYDALTRARSLGDVLENPALREFFPQEWIEIYDEARKAGYTAMTGASREIYEANQAFDSCAYLKDEEQRTTCEALAMQAALKEGLLVPALQMTAKRSLHIRELKKAMGQTQDLKEAAEMQGVIDAEQAEVLNQQNELEMFQQGTQTQQELLEQRAYEQTSETFAKRGGIVPVPTRF